MSDKKEDKYKFDAAQQKRSYDKAEFTFNANDSFIDIFYSFFSNIGMLLRLSIILILFLSFIF